MAAELLYDDVLWVQASCDRPHDFCIENGKAVGVKVLEIWLLLETNLARDKNGAGLGFSNRRINENQVGVGMLNDWRSGSMYMRLANCLFTLVGVYSVHDLPFQSHGMFGNLSLG